MKITTEYNKSDLHRGKCRSCGDRTLIVDEEVAEKERYVNWCPECIEADKFYDMTMKDL